MNKFYADNLKVFSLKNIRDKVHMERIEWLSQPVDLYSRNARRWCWIWNIAVIDCNLNPATFSFSTQNFRTYYWTVRNRTVKGCNIISINVKKIVQAKIRQVFVLEMNLDQSTIDKKIFKTKSCLTQIHNLLAQNFFQKTKIFGKFKGKKFEIIYKKT